MGKVGIRPGPQILKDLLVYVVKISEYLQQISPSRRWPNISALSCLMSDAQLTSGRKVSIPCCSIKIILLLLFTEFYKALMTGSSCDSGTRNCKAQIMHKEE
jgi:hypothetical protein